MVGQERQVKGDEEDGRGGGSVSDDKIIVLALPTHKHTTIYQ